MRDHFGNLRPKVVSNARQWANALVNIVYQDHSRRTAGAKRTLTSVVTNYVAFRLDGAQTELRAITWRPQGTRRVIQLADLTLRRKYRDSDLVCHRALSHGFDARLHARAVIGIVRRAHCCYHDETAGVGFMYVQRGVPLWRVSTTFMFFTVIDYKGNLSRVMVMLVTSGHWFGVFFNAGLFLFR